MFIYICGNGVTHIDLEGNAPLLFIHIYTAELAFFLQIIKEYMYLPHSDATVLFKILTGKQML